MARIAVSRQGGDPAGVVRGGAEPHLAFDERDKFETNPLWIWTPEQC